MESSHFINEKRESVCFESALILRLGIWRRCEGGVSTVGLKSYSGISGIKWKFLERENYKVARFFGLKRKRVNIAFGQTTGLNSTTFSSGSNGLSLRFD